MRLSPATALAGLALFVSLGGTSYAVTKIAKNSVGSDQVKDRSLQAVDLAPGVAISGPRGPRGPQGVAGDSARNAIIVRERPGDQTMAFGAGASIDVASIRLPAGNWLVRGSAEIVYFPNASPHASWFSCQLIQGDQSLANSQAFTGNATGAFHSPVLTPQKALATAGTTITLRCSHESELPGGSSQPLARHSSLTAIQAATLDVAPAG